MGFLSKLFSHKSVEEVADEIANTYAEEVQAVTAEQTDTAGAEIEQVNMLEVSDTGEIKARYAALLEQHGIPYESGHHTAELILNADEVFKDDYDDVEAQIYMERKMYDHLVKFCLHTSYSAEENLANYAKYMSEADQRLVAQDIIKRMKRRAPECKKGNDYDYFAGWIMRLYNSSPECEMIAREVAEEIVKENPNKPFKRWLESVGVL